MIDEQRQNDFPIAPQPARGGQGDTRCRGSSSLTCDPEASTIENGDLAREVVYAPYQHLGFGWRAWREALDGLWASRELIWRLFRRNTAARYRESVLGYVWAVVPTLLTVIAFTTLSRARLLAIDATELPYPLFVLLGMTIWQLFADGIVRSAQVLVASTSLITKINFAKESLVFASLGESLIDFAVRLVLVILLFALYRVVPAWTVVFVPLLLIPLLLLTAGIGLLVALANGVFRDVGSFLPLLMTYGIFLAPIVYPPPTGWPKSLINYINPVSPFIIALRDLATRGTLSQPGGLALGCLAAVLAFLLGLRIFHLGVARIAERI